MYFSLFVRHIFEFAFQLTNLLIKYKDLKAPAAEMELNSSTAVVEEPEWKLLCAYKRKALQESIPKEWRIPNLPRIREQANVLGLPETCGILSEREIMITETTDVDVILENLRKAEWTAVEVTMAFCKRAVVAHQLVSKKGL